MQSKFNYLFEEVMDGLQSNNIKYIYLKNINLPIKLQKNGPFIKIYNSYPIKDIIKQYFVQSYYNSNIKAWIIESYTLDEVYNKLIQILSNKNLLKPKEENLRFIPNRRLTDYSITITNIEQQFGQFGKYLLLTGVDNNNIIFNLNSNKLIKEMFESIYLSKILYNLPNNLILKFNGTVISNNYRNGILVNNIIITNRVQLFNNIKSYIQSLPLKTYKVQLVNSRVVGHGRYITETIQGKTKSQVTYNLDKKYPQSIIKTIQEI